MPAFHILAAVILALVPACSGSSAYEPDAVSVLQARHGQDIRFKVKQASTHEKKQVSSGMGSARNRRLNVTNDWPQPWSINRWLKSSRRRRSCSFSVPNDQETFVDECQTETVSCYNQFSQTSTEDPLAASMLSCASSWCCKHTDRDHCEETMLDFVEQNNFGNRGNQATFVATRYCERLWSIYCPDNCRVGRRRGSSCTVPCSGLLQTASPPEEDQALLPGLLQEQLTKNLVQRAGQEGQDTVFDESITGKCLS